MRCCVEELLLLGVEVTTEGLPHHFPPPPTPGIGEAVLSHLESLWGMPKPLSVGLTCASFTQWPACLRACYYLQRNKSLQWELVLNSWALILFVYLFVYLSQLQNHYFLHKNLYRGCWKCQFCSEETDNETRSKSGFLPSSGQFDGNWEVSKLSIGKMVSLSPEPS